MLVLKTNVAHEILDIKIEKAQSLMTLESVCR